MNFDRFLLLAGGIGFSACAVQAWRHGDVGSAILSAIFGLGMLLAVIASSMPHEPRSSPRH